MEKGDRIRLVRMDDPHPVEPGTEGTVLRVDDRMMLAYVEWDDGRTLNLCLDVDRYEIVEGGR